MLVASVSFLGVGIEMKLLRLSAASGERALSTHREYVPTAGAPVRGGGIPPATAASQDSPNGRNKTRETPGCCGDDRAGNPFPAGRYTAGQRGLLTSRLGSARQRALSPSEKMLQAGWCAGMTP